MFQAFLCYRGVAESYSLNFRTMALDPMWTRETTSPYPRGLVTASYLSLSKGVTGSSILTLNGKIRHHSDIDEFLHPDHNKVKFLETLQAR